MVNKHDDIQRSILYLKHIDLHILSYIHTSNEMHSKACAHACAHAHMRMHTMSTFDTIYLLAWIGTAQIVPICFDTTHVLFDSGICQYSSQLNAVLAPLVSESKLRLFFCGTFFQKVNLEYFLKSQIQISTFENLKFEKLVLQNSTSNSTSTEFL